MRPDDKDRLKAAFALLDQQRMRLDGMPAYVARIGLYRDFNALFFRLPPARLAALLSV